MKQRLIKYLTLLSLLQLVTGCSLAIDTFSNNLNRAILSNNDPQTVLQGLPAYLILLDGFVEADPEDEGTLMVSAKLMSAYGGLLGSQLDMMADKKDIQYQTIKDQQKKLNIKALERSSLALCLYEEYLCNLTNLKYTEFEQRMLLIDEDDLGMLYSFATVWVAWLQLNSDDWNARAQLPQIKLLMQTLVTIDETWEHAGAHMYLGVLNSLLPVTMGGKPDIGKEHFDIAIKLTDGKNLMAKVLYAEYYARLMFDEELHNKLIADVLATNEKQANLTLLNTLAKQRALILQSTAADFF